MAARSREQAAANRDRIVVTAARLFREGGFDRIGVAERMHGEEITHGDLGGNDASKEDLMAEAVPQAIATTLPPAFLCVVRRGANPTPTEDDST